MKLTVLVFLALLVASTSNTQSQTSMAKAKAIMGKNFYGPQEISKALDFKIDSSAIPSVSFSEKELERANSLGLILILRLPLSINSLKDTLKGKLPNNSKLLFDCDQKKGQLKKRTWYAEKDWFLKSDSEEAYWALTSNKFIMASTNKNYLQQTKQLVNYLKTKMFSTLDTLPLIYQKAINEWDSLQPVIEKMMESKNEKIYEPMLESLKINQLCRPSPFAIIYDMVIIYKNNKSRSFRNSNIMTNIIGVSVGYFDCEGIIIDEISAEDTDAEIGCTFNRKL